MRAVLSCRMFLCACAAAAALAAAAAPRVPSNDAEVLATVPARASDPQARALAALRAAWRANPQDLGAALALADAYFDATAAEGDPRYLGHAQAVLAPWWALPAPPPAVRVLRAQLAQFEHRFADALADLDAAIAAEPDNGRAWAWRTAIHLVLTNYDEARRGCARLQASALIAAACTAQVDGLTGRAAQASASLRAALAAAAQADGEQRLWALTRLAEIDERRGDFAAAESAYREALALGIADVYLRAADADFLLDRGRAAELPALLAGAERADVLLLRLAIAAKATRSAEAPRLAAELFARFDAAHRRGDTTHRKEESRATLALAGDVPRALALAQANYAQQREPADARILLEAAVAARDRAAAQPVLDWMARSGIESVALRALAAKLPP